MENRNISIASKNGYTLTKVKKAKQYLDEIGNNKRNFDFARLVEMYNDIYGTHELASGCKCHSPKYYNGISNYFKFGKLTLINNGIATEGDFEVKDDDVISIENEVNRIQLGSVLEPSEGISEDKVEDTKEEEKEVVTEEKKRGRKKKE